MKLETQEWLEKAEGDLKVARREAQTTDPVYDAVCFHAQQCAEKYLKALLEEHNITFPRIHDLVALLSLSGGLIPELDPLKPRLAHRVGEEQTRAVPASSGLRFTRRSRSD